MTDNEIIKALEHCLNNEDCDGCISLCSNSACVANNLQIILDLINRQKAEIERLEERLKREAKMQYDLCGQIVDLKNMLPIARAEGIKEFAEKLKAIRRKMYPCYVSVDLFEGVIDNLVKEFTEGGNDG